MIARSILIGLMVAAGPTLDLSNNRIDASTSRSRSVDSYPLLMACQSRYPPLVV